MTIYFDLSGFGKTTDGELLKRVDRQVAGYYLAVPIAGEDNCVTVATAYPDNAAALRVLERLLRAAVVPVSSPETDVRAAIARIYPESAATARAILAWCEDPAWRPAVSAAAEAFGRSTGQEVHTLDSATPLAEVIDASGRGDRNRDDADRGHREEVALPCAKKHRRLPDEPRHPDHPDHKYEGNDGTLRLRNGE